MAGLRCHSCGADVNPFAERCDRCGADPEVTVVELGGVGDDPRPSGARPRRGGRRAWLPILGVAAAAWATFAIVDSLGGDDEAASEAPRAASETTAASIRVPRATTTTVSPLLLDAVRIDEPIGLHLLADTSGVLLDLDLDTGALERHRFWGRLLAGDERGVLVISGSDLVWHPFPLGSAAITLESDVRDAWLLEDTDAVWAPRQGEYVLLALDGSGPMATAPGPPQAYPTGVSGDLLVVAGLGRVFTIDTAGAVADLGSGVPVASGYGYVVIDRCDAGLVCGPVHIELATGKTEPIDRPAGHFGTGARISDTTVIIGVETGWWLGPGGQVVYAAFGEGGAGLFVADEVSVTEVIQPGGSSSEVFTNVSFSPDGRWIVASGNGSVWLAAVDGSTSGGVALDRFAGGVALLVPVPG